LPLEQPGRQVPVGLLGKLGGDLIPRLALLLVLKLPLQVGANRFAHLFLGLEVAHLLQEVGGQLGQLQLLDVEHFKLDVELLAAEGLVRGVLSQLDLAGFLVAGLGAGQQLAEVFHLAVEEA
jgi:hypothetical protein